MSDQRDREAQDFEKRIRDAHQAYRFPEAADRKRKGKNYKGRFIMVPVNLPALKGCHPCILLVYGAVLSECLLHDGVSALSLKAIARIIQRNPETVRASLRQLEAKGLIIRQRRRDPQDNRHLATLIRIRHQANGKEA